MATPTKLPMFGMTIVGCIVTLVLCTDAGNQRHHVVVPESGPALLQVSSSHAARVFLKQETAGREKMNDTGTIAHAVSGEIANSRNPDEAMPKFKISHGEFADSFLEISSAISEQVKEFGNFRRRSLHKGLGDVTIKEMLTAAYDTALVGLVCVTCFAAHSSLMLDREFLETFKFSGAVEVAVILVAVVVFQMAARDYAGWLTFTLGTVANGYLVCSGKALKWQGRRVL